MTDPHKPLSVAVIGAGMAGRSHANGWRTATTVFDLEGLPPVRLAAIADANLPLAEDCARRYGYDKAVGSWQEIVDDPDIDVVSIVVGNDLHRPIAEALVRAGKHVFCEKPLAGTLEDGRAMAELEGGAAREAGVVTGVGFTYRRNPAMARVAQHVADGDLGPLSLVEGRYDCDYACDPRGPLTWRFTGPLGSGALADVGAHLIDLAEFVCGPIESVAGGTLSIQVRERPTPLGFVVGHGAAPVSDEMGPVTNEDTATFTARFAGGAAATLACSRTAFGMPNGLRLEVYGLNGRAAVDWHRPAEYVYDDEQPAAATRGERRIIAGPHLPYFNGGYPMQAAGNGGGNAEMFAYECRAFLDQVLGIDGGTPPNASFTDAYRTMLVVDAVVRSHRSGGAAVTVPSPGSEL